MKSVQGNLLVLAEAGHFDVIVHGCNCFRTMGGGIALQIAAAYPEARQADDATKSGDRAKLGTFTSAQIERAEANFVVVNAYTQYDTRAAVAVDYDAVTKVFAAIKQEFAGKRIGYPKIGAGLAGGDWKRLSKIIDDALEGEHHTLVEYRANGAN